MSPPSKHGRAVPAWDLPTRLFHWALLLLIIDGYVSRHYGYSDLTWHKWNGYGILTLIIFRIIWGFVGGSTARFLAFFPTPMAMLRYGASLIGARSQRFLGHNPLGAAMILAMLLVIFVQGLTGLFNSDDVLFDGPFVKLVSERAVKLAGVLHHYNFELILILVSIHVAANLFYHFIKREPLIAAMLTGEKPAADYLDAQEARGGSSRLAVICLAVAAALVLGTIRLVGGEL
ncbi:MAG: cytochrome b/b6 domain-containing protein [Hyphomicrobiales bacterium]